MEEDCGRRHGFTRGAGSKLHPPTGCGDSRKSRLLGVGCLLFALGFWLQLRCSGDQRKTSNMNPLIRPVIPADVPAIIALAKEAATAAQWSQAQYEQVFLREGTPTRLALVIEEDAGIR